MTGPRVRPQDEVLALPRDERVRYVRALGWTESPWVPGDPAPVGTRVMDARPCESGSRYAGTVVADAALAAVRNKRKARERA